MTGLHHFLSVLINVCIPHRLMTSIALCFGRISEALALIYGTDDPIGDVLSSRPIAPSAASDRVFEMIGGWISECQQGHKECGGSLYPQLPSRVIDVGGNGRDPFLFISHNQPGEWIALSHCWGSQKPPQTLLANLEDRCRKITEEAMPRLFQDAIEITRRLGCKYLWIDTLCIIQNCIEDLRTELARMGDIYSRAHLTIAAEASVDCTNGIFYNADIERPRNVIQIAAHLSEERIHGNLIIDMDPIWDAASSRGPLSTRSWTLQENLLSKRVLLYTGQQVWWQCREMQRSERQPLWEELSNLTPAGQWDSNRIFPLTAASSKIERMNPVRQAAYYQPIQCWYRIVNDFCSRKATYRHDTFPAISGIAREYHRHLSQDYLAGLWRNDIHMGLVWSCPCPNVSENKDYVAPSFSWASLDFNTMQSSLYGEHGIYHHELLNYPPTRLQAEILSLNIQNVDSDPFGQVIGGRLQLTARCTEVCSCMIQRCFFDCYSDGQHPALTFDILRRGYNIKAGDTPKHNECTVDFHIGRSCVQHSSAVHKNYLYVHILSHSRFAFALILVEAPDNTGEWKRVGLAILKEATDTLLIWPFRTLTII